jgi:PEGA domain
MMSSGMKKIFVCGGIVVILVVLGALLLHSSSNNSGQLTNNNAKVTLDYNIASTQGVTVRFNNAAASPGSDNTYTIAPGSYALTVAKAGYRQFVANLTVRNGQSFIVEVQLQPLASTAITNPKQVAVPGASILNATYFYNQTWAVVLVEEDGDQGVVVSQYNAANQSWANVLGPGTSFDESDVQNLPAQVSSYLMANNYVNPGS